MKRLAAWLINQLFNIKPLEQLDSGPCPQCGLTDGWHQEPLP